MAILDYLLRKNKKPSAAVAKERLQIILAHENGGAASGPDYLPELKQELLQVISKYTHIKLDEINVNLDKEDGCDILEVNVILPKE